MLVNDHGFKRNKTPFNYGTFANMVRIVTSLIKSDNVSIHLGLVAEYIKSCKVILVI